ncbi:MAG: EpsG family protein [Epsilonproteobacteria bacterium]|nr:EpsG family protein [Campylobacterota bacterium]
MVAYYLVFLALWIPAIKYKDFISKRKLSIGFLAFGLFLIIFTGLRHHVGGDWNNYLHMFHTIIPYMSYDLAFSHDDPGFWLLSYWMYDIGWGLYGVNFIGAVIFIIGLFSLLKREPNPWLGLAVAFPYLIIVVSMGYTRQAIAIGFIMWGIAYLRDDKFYKFILVVFFAATFHKTAVLMIGIGIFNKGRGRFFKILATLIIGMGMWNAFFAEAQTDLWYNYVSSGDYQSSGAMIRVVMNVIPALLLIYLRKQWKKEFDDYSFWYMIALGSIISLFLVQFASTAVDRVALYFIPLQVIVFSRIVILLQHKIRAKTIKLLVLGYYFMVLNVWLWFGVFSMWWLPYRNVIFLGLF